MILRSALAIAQAGFIPGFLALRLVRYRTGSLLETLTLSMALSLIINYVIVSWLTFAGLYSRTTVILFLFAEAVLALILLVAWLRSGERRSFVLKIPCTPPENWTVAFPVSLALTTIGAAVIASIWRISAFPVFTAWDAVFSWNRWAYDWYVGILPRGTMSYPQLLTANWSLMYRVAGSPELQFVALALPLLFGLSILLMFYDLALRKRRAEYLLAIPLCIIAVPAIKNGFLFEGLADLPLACMAFTTFYILELRPERVIRDWRGLVLPMAVASGAAMTKLNGGYAILVVLALALAGHVASRRELTWRDWIRSAAVSGGLLLVICGPWYGQKVLEISRTGSLLNAQDLVNSAGMVAGSNSTIAKLVAAVHMFPLGWYSIAVALVVLVISALMPRTRWVALVVVLPYTALWAVYLGVSLRNWTMMVPFAVYLTAFALGFVLEKVAGMDMRIPGARIRDFGVSFTALGVLIAALLAVSVVGMVVFPDVKLVADQLGRQRQVGHPPLNQVAYSVLQQHPDMNGTLLTDYWYLSVLPQFRDDAFRLEYTDRLKVSTPSYGVVSVDMLKSASYLLLSNCIPQETQSFIDSRIADGSYTVLATYRSEEVFAPYYEGHPVELRFIKVNAQDKPDPPNGS